MKHLFTEKYIRGLENNKKDRLEIYDSFCPYLGCRIGKNGQKTYFVRKKYLGRNIRVTIGKTDEVGLEFARKKAFSLLEKIQNGINPNEEKYELSKEISLGIFYEEYMERHVIAKTSKRNVDNSSGIYRRHLTQWKNKRLSELNMRMIELHFNSVKKTHGIFAANQMLTMLRHMYNKAIQWGWDGRNPTTGIKKFHVEPRDRFLAPDEIQRLFAALNEEPNPVYKTFFYTLLFTGQRRGNVLSMRWDDVDFKTGVWYIARTKNGTSLRVPLVEQLTLMLKELKLQSGGTSWVFPRPFNPAEHLTEPRDVWERIKKRAQIANLRMHDLRRTVASYECMNGENLSVVSKTLNHKTLAATQVYARVDTSAVSRALQKTVDVFEQIAKQEKAF